MNEKGTCQYCRRSGPMEVRLTDGGTYCNRWCYQQSNHPTHYREHNDIVIPQALRGGVWNDRSYHNDACARSEWELPNGKIIQVWAEHTDREQREFTDGPRFAVCLLPDDQYEGNGEQIWEGEDEAELAKAIDALATREGALETELPASAAPDLSDEGMEKLGREGRQASLDAHDELLAPADVYSFLTINEEPHYPGWTELTPGQQVRFLAGYYIEGEQK